MATKKRSTSHVIADPGAPFVPDYAGLLARVERQFKLTPTSTSIEARKGSYLSTGMLCTDLILGGGLVSGAWATVYGGEQSAKSTTMMHTTINAVDTGIPLIANFDYEGSVDPSYYSSALSSITGNRLGFDDVFGCVDLTTNEIIKPPKVKLYTESVGEAFFDSMSSLLRDLPDIQYLDGQWYYVYANTNANRALVDGRHDKSLFSEFNSFWVPRAHGRPQSLLMLDSYPCMFPEDLDADEKGAGLGAVARMFSENIPKLAPKLKRKGVVVLGANQIRLKPMARGNPEYEPAGQAVRFTSSVRLHNAAVYHPSQSTKYEEEDSVTVEGGIDTYFYVRQRATKNKTGGIPNAETWQRIWMADASGAGRGFDPVWDTYQYLKHTGQVSGNMKKLKINTPWLQVEGLTWWDFKALVLLRGPDLKGHCSDIGIKINPRLRAGCREQLDSGAGYRLYLDKIRQGGGKGTDD